MSENRAIEPIRPEVIAHKLAAIRNREFPELLEEITRRPRLVEMLLFLQSMSLEPGGLVKFAEDMVAALPHRFGTDSMRLAKPGSYSVELKCVIIGEIPSSYQPMGCPGNPCDDFSTKILLDDYDPVLVHPEDERKLKAFLSAVSNADLLAICHKAAIEYLPGYLADLCTQKDKSFAPKVIPGFGSDVWFMGDVAGVVIEMMDRRAVEVSGRLAMTTVAKKVFDALDFAWQENAVVRVVGNSRFGKSESARAYCQMWPGRVRLFNVPCSNSLSDLFLKIGEALGMDVSYGSRPKRLKERIEYVLKHTRIFLAADESHFLAPQNYTPTTAPARLNWVRTEIIDRKLPLALIVTPQNFMPVMDRFVKKTGYAMEQFFGRNNRIVDLPDEISRSEMLAVARIQLPELDTDYLGMVADYAAMSQSYLQAVEDIAKLARYISRREGHRRITVADIDNAASEVIPRRASVEKEAIADTGKPPLTAPERAIPPHRKTTPGRLDFPSSSLRGAALEMPNPHLTAVDS